MQLGWIDFSKEDRDKVHEVMNLLQEPGSVDELGIGPVRDGFANYFFPGTSTVQTKAKYFLLVPYLLQEAIDGKFGNDINRILARIEDEEYECAKIMYYAAINAGQPVEGIIGNTNLPGKFVLRKPSNIYWSGIKTFGIVCSEQDLSIQNVVASGLYLRNNVVNLNIGNRNDKAEEGEKDDLTAGKEKRTVLIKLPTSHTDDWRKNLRIDLTYDEAVFLRCMIKANARKNGQDSLLVYMLKNNLPKKEYPDFEALYEDIKDDLKAGAHNELEHMMKLACDFNKLVLAARTRYNLQLSGGNNERAKELWQDMLGAGMSNVAYVDIDDVVDSLKLNQPRLKNFLKELQFHLLAEDYDKADICIKDWERKKKRERAKLSKSDKYSDDIWIGGEKLDYRYFDALTILKDIYKGEASGNV